MLEGLKPGVMYEVVMVVDNDGYLRLCVKDDRAHKLIDVTHELKQQFSESQ